MNKIFFLTPVFVFFLAVSGFTSEISRITMAELYEKADLIVMAGVTQVAQKKDKDEVTIAVELYLKGNSNDREFTFTLITRGGVKDFDPVLNVGDTGVFFLKQKWGKIQKAYWGSVAVFSKNHFDLTGGKLRMGVAGPLAAWRDYRIKLGQALNIAEYESGFLKGFSGPSKLVDGSADFDLGLSDGKLARKGIVPAW